MALRPTMREVLAGLAAEGQVDAEIEARARTALEVRQQSVGASPWFVKALAGFGAWMSAAFMLSFFGCVGLWKEEVALSGLGAAMTVASVFVRRTTRGPFMEQLALALCLSGVGALLVGLVELKLGTSGVALVAMGVGIALLATFPDVILSFLATVGICIAGGVLAAEDLGVTGVDAWMLMGATAFCGLLLFEPRLRRGFLGARVGPIAFALACAVPGWLLFRNVAGGQQGHGYLFGFARDAMPGALLSSVLALLAGVTGWRVLREQGSAHEPRVWAPALAALVLLTGMTLGTPGVLMAALMLTLGFHRRSRVLLGLAVAFLVSFGAYYYYDLRLTLLLKSLTLVGSGLLLLGVRGFISRREAAVAVEAR
jgi:hypothetical protein